ncbi:hypothetical protein HKD37_12G034510 [Glycine soja]
MFVLTARPLALFASAHSVFLNEVIFIALKITKPPLDKVLPELLDRVVKSLDVCNAISLGLDAIKNLQRLAEIAVAALKQTPLGDGQVRPAKKALSSLVAAMLHNDSNAAAKGTERTRSFGRRARTPPPPPLYTNNDYTARQDRRVCENLFSHGPLTLDQLVRYTDLTKDQVRNSLLVLVQHNCAQALVSAPQDDDDDADRLRVRTQYLVLFDNIIHRLRFPKFLEIVLRKLDEEFVKLLVRLLQDGRLTLKQMETTSRKLGAKSVKVNSARIADSIHYGCIPDDKFGGFKDVGTNVSCVVSRRDMATQMSPQGPYSLAEAQNKSKAGKKKKAKSEEAKISAWENLQKAKAEAAIRKLEMKLEKRRASSMDKIMNKRILA